MNVFVFETAQHESQIFSSIIAKRTDLILRGVYSDLTELHTAIAEDTCAVLFWHIADWDYADMRILNEIPLYNPPIVIVSSKIPPSNTAFNLGIIDIIPPLSTDSDFERVFKKARYFQEKRPQNDTISTLQDRFIFVKSDYKIVKIDLHDLLYIESLGEYVRFYTKDQKIVSLLSLNDLASFLPQNYFFRIHRSHIINIRHIGFIQNFTVAIGTAQLSIAKNRKNELLMLLENWGMFH